MSDKTIFGLLLNVNIVFNGQLIYHFLLRQIPQEANANGISFSVLRKNVCFTQNEFNIIIGLWPTRVTLEKDCDNKSLQTLLFRSENKKIITCLELEEIFKNFEFTNDEGAVKVALALFIETVMVGKDKKTQFGMDILGKVDDEEVFKNFDWSTFFYTSLLNSLKTILQGKKEAYMLKSAKSSKVVAYYNIKGYVLAFQTVVQAKLKLSTQEKVLMESQIREDDNMEMEDDESMPDIDNSDNTTSDDTTNNQSLDNNNLQSTSSPQLSPRKKKRQTVADESEMHPMTKKKSHRSNDKKQQSHSKSYKTLKKNIKEVNKDVSALTSIVCRMDDTIKKQSLELFEMKQILERFL
ncbi:Ulp1-like peptidase [Cucumis melo var. makuwa]|uniref:Ulp1-like peptidase n=1 Tax=Cucumis melo var. makuwa TaxID=1194695 RepID=A0A5A7V9T1_CUCMM|nr:Ulp1-like peptidase [Cucumis melo var. makuwa]TYK23497.1 Ulp1-like peptidase [Cucumis melo var. makuwa]